MLYMVEQSSQSLTVIYSFFQSLEVESVPFGACFGGQQNFLKFEAIYNVLFELFL